MTNETDLIRGYGDTPRTVPCACGGWITAHLDFDEIEFSVQEHQKTTVHKLWRTWVERLAKEPKGPPE